MLRHHCHHGYISCLKLWNNHGHEQLFLVLKLFCWPIHSSQSPPSIYFGSLKDDSWIINFHVHPVIFLFSLSHDRWAKNLLSRHCTGSHISLAVLCLRGQNDLLINMRLLSPIQTQTAKLSEDIIFLQWFSSLCRLFACSQKKTLGTLQLRLSNLKLSHMYAWIICVIHDFRVRQSAHLCQAKGP